MLEAAYGQGFLSEGGKEAIDDLVKGFKLDNKKMLDIGSGLGGAAIHFAEKFNAMVIGIEINQMMVDESSNRIPDKLQNQVRFLYYDDIRHLPFPDEFFDLAYSKGVFVHLDTEDKSILFKEISRVLKKDGYFIIGDWLSPVQDHWGEKMGEMMKIDGLTLFANTDDQYKDVIRRVGFELISIDAEDEIYANYNKEIVKHLKKPEIQKKLKEIFTTKEIEDSIKGYTLICQAIQEKELFVRKIICKK
jgi:phosphoethanolamine N-methyltransferase